MFAALEWRHFVTRDMLCNAIPRDPILCMNIVSKLVCNRIVHRTHFLTITDPYNYDKEIDGRDLDSYLTFKVNYRFRIFLHI